MTDLAPERLTRLQRMADIAPFPGTPCPIPASTMRLILAAALFAAITRSAA